MGQKLRPMRSRPLSALTSTADMSYSAVPDKVLKMPPCCPRDPSVIPHDAQPYLKLAPSTQFVSVELTYRDGSVSEIKSFRR
jgi:hypothetical protein